MTVPVNNANFTSPTAPETRQGGKRPDSAPRDAAPTAAASSDDRVKLSSRPAEPPADSGIATTEGARASLERLKQLLGDNPAGAVRAHGHIDPQSAASALSLAA